MKTSGATAVLLLALMACDRHVIYPSGEQMVGCYSSTGMTAAQSAAIDLAAIQANLTTAYRKGTRPGQGGKPPVRFRVVRDGVGSFMVFGRGNELIRNNDAMTIFVKLMDDECARVSAQHPESETLEKQR